MTANDRDLLEQYARQNSQDAFAALVQRHLDLVYSAALRQVHSPQLAEEIAQSVFADLARNADKISGAGVSLANSLTPWLYSVTRRTAIDVIRKESRRRLREQIAVEMNNMNATADEWTQIAPLLDDAMAALDETDRGAILLRYFENKSLREVGEALGASEDAAQKRVSRAVERLREFFSKRNVTIGVSGLAVLISANAVQSAPVGLAALISSAAFAGTAVSTSTAIATTKIIAMTTLQKSIIGVALVATVGTGVFEAHQASQLREQVQTLQQEQAPLTEQIRHLQRQRDDATNRLAGLEEENAQWQSGQKETELLKLRGEVGRLRSDSQELARLKAAEAHSTTTTTAEGNAQTNLQTQPIEVQAKQVAERNLRSAKWSALLSLEEEDLKALAVAMNIPDDVSKMEAKKALKDAAMKSYSLYFRFKYTYELMRDTVQEQQNGNVPAQ